MTEQELTELLEKHSKKELSAVDRTKLETWYIATAKNSTPELTETQVKQSLTELRTQLPLKYVSRTKSLWPRIAAAACLLITISAALYFYADKKDTGHGNIYVNDIPAGRNSATLTLANGQKIMLAAVKNGELARQSGVSISKDASGKVIYQLTGASGTKVEYNTLTTAKGEQVQIVLPDGSSVWLNAFSELRFPSTFAGLTSRSVTLSGEAYFEIFKNKVVPFLVKTDNQQIEVLGTHFNVSNYKDQLLAKTTLLEGSIKLNNNTLLVPGQQATVNTENNMVKVSAIDTELAVAWKNNKFIFESERIENIMKMIERWYNVEVVYEGKVPDDKFGGSVSRFDNVSKVLDILQLTGNVHFKVEGRRITVMK